MPAKPYSDLYPYQVKTAEDAFLYDLIVGDLVYMGATQDEAEGFVATNFGVLKENAPEPPPWFNNSEWGRIGLNSDPYDPVDPPGGVWII